MKCGMIRYLLLHQYPRSIFDFQFDSTEINHLVCTPAGSGALPELPALGPGHVFRPHRGRHATVTHSLLRPPLQSHLRRLQQALRLLPQVHDEGHVQPGGTGRVQIHPRRQTRRSDAAVSGFAQSLSGSRSEQASGPQLLVPEQLLRYWLPERRRQSHDAFHPDYARV